MSASRLSKAVRRRVETPPVLSLLATAELLKMRSKWITALVLTNIASKVASSPHMEGLVALALGHCFRNQTPSDWSSAIAHLRIAHECFTSLPKSRDREPYLMRAVLLLGDSLVRRNEMGDLAEAEEIALTAEAMLEEARTQTKSWRVSWASLTQRCLDFNTLSMRELGEIYYYTHSWPEGEKLLRSLVPTLVRTRGTHHPMTIEAQRDLASMLVNQDKYEEAEAAYRIARKWNEFRPAFGPEEKAAIDYNIVMCLSERCLHEQAGAELDQMDLAADLLHYANGEWTLKLARLTYMRLGQYAKVVRMCRRFQPVLDGHRVKYGPCSAASLRNMNDHASALQSLCRWDEAVEVLREMCSRESSDRRPPETTLDSRMELAHSLLSSQQLDEASYEYRKCLEIARDAVADLRNDSTSSENDRRIRNILRHLAHIYELTTNRTGALTAYAQLQHEFLARPGRPQNIWTYQWLRGKMFLLQERWDYAIRVLVSAPSSRLGLEAAKMADRPVTDETKKSLRAILERPDLDARTATTDLPLEIHTHHEAVSVTAAKTTEPAAKGVVIMTKVKETSETKDTHGADDGANTASGGNMVQPTPEIATDTYTVAQAVKDAVLAALEKQVFQKQHATIVDTADMDDEESISDEDHDFETVDGVLRAKYAFPLVPQDTEWEQLQYPRLPNTYQKWVQQKREAERNRRIWM
ncbi:Sulfite oxidase [Verticillium dahliae VDG1]|nr:DNA polymerase zeta catalytic subunit [Verticillium dahliae VDG2]KAF3353429.1 Sulfite oxidase [Verticillium dahliae VDG1]PNH72247.1 hypothetical protein VD0001_g5302 [Verticillium dahliae]RXG43160.1 hypothetical protein VDGE_10301 [Verticillium dahliae]